MMAEKHIIPATLDIDELEILDEALEQEKIFCVEARENAYSLGDDENGAKWSEHGHRVKILQLKIQQWKATAIYEASK